MFFTGTWKRENKREVDGGKDWSTIRVFIAAAARTKISVWVSDWVEKFLN